jgi:hypothetical protein
MGTLWIKRTICVSGYRSVVICRGSLEPQFTWFRGNIVVLSPHVSISIHPCQMYLYLVKRTPPKFK